MESLPMENIEAATSSINTSNGLPDVVHDPLIMKKLLLDEEATDDWPLEKIYNNGFQTAEFWLSMLEIIEADDTMSFKYNLANAVNNLHLNCPNISSFVRKVKGVRAKALKNGDNSILTKAVIDRNKVDNLGEECVKLGISEEWLNNPREINVSFISRKLILELRLYRNRNCVLDKTCALWIQFLCKLDTIPHLGRVWLSFERIFNKKNKLNLDAKDVYLNGQYHPPKPKKCATCNNKQKLDTDKQENKNFNFFAQEQNQFMKLRREKMSINLQLYNCKKEMIKLRGQLALCQQKIRCFSVRNINKRIKRRNEKVRKLLEENSDLRSKNNKMIKAINDLKRKYKRKSSLFNYYKKNRNTAISGTVMDSCPQQIDHDTTQVLKQNILQLENENTQMKEKIDEILQSKEICTFQNGKYSDCVREVYATLLACNVGVKNVEHVVRTVLQKLAGMDVGRLPKKTFAEVMLVEAKALAQIQSLEAMVGSNNTLHTDGTKRKGREYGGLQIGTSSGQYSLGISELVRGNTDSFFSMIKEIFNDLSSLTDQENTEKKTAEILNSIKNMMTDRHVVNDSLKNYVEKWKTECLPLVIENFNNFTDETKKN